MKKELSKILINLANTLFGAGIIGIIIKQSESQKNLDETGMYLFIVFMIFISTGIILLKKSLKK